MMCDVHASLGVAAAQPFVFEDSANPTTDTAVYISAFRTQGQENT